LYLPYVQVKLKILWIAMECIHGDVIFMLPYVSIPRLCSSAWSHCIPIHIGGGNRSLCPWTILARKDRNTLIEKSVTLIEQL